MDYISFDELLMIQKENESANESLSPVPPHQISKRIGDVGYYTWLLAQKESQEQGKLSSKKTPKLIRQSGYVKGRLLDREEEEEKANACPCYDCNKKKIQ